MQELVRRTVADAPEPLWRRRAVRPCSGPENMAIRHPALRVVSIAAGVVVIGYLLHLATLSTRDCTVGLYIFDNCLWVSISQYMGLPQTKFLRAAALEVVGLALAGGIYAAIRFLILPGWRGEPQASRQQAKTLPPESPSTH